MPLNKSPYQSRPLRLTAQEARHQQLNNEIIALIGKLSLPEGAETIWFELRALGATISMASFNARLKKLVEAGVVQKIAAGYHKNTYTLAAIPPRRE